jgi:hypothetical protein
MIAGKCAIFLAAIFLTAPALAAAGDEAGFIERFIGKWSGGGPYKRTAGTPSVNVKCTIAGESSPNRIKVGGTCRAAIVITRKIAMDVTYDPASDSYRGTYKGEMEGLAQLSGKRKGDGVEFQVAWPEVLNGDRSASMTISSSGNGVMHLRMSDRTSADGPVAVMWDLTFRR